jgi:hypothetical protein
LEWIKSNALKIFLLSVINSNLILNFQFSRSLALAHIISEREEEGQQQQQQQQQLGETYSVHHIRSFIFSLSETFYHHFYTTNRDDDKKALNLTHFV